MIDRLIELEEGFWSSAGNGDYYREHMAEYGLCVLPVGILDRVETAGAIDQSDGWAEFELNDVTTIDLGDDQAALCYRAEAVRADESSTGYAAFISSVYTRLRGQWKLSLHQQTPIDF